MHNNKLSESYIGFALHGYENEILSWLWQTARFFEKSGYPVKSVTYDIDRNKVQRKSLKKFQEVIENDTGYPVDKLYSFQVFAGENLRYPATWNYGCKFDEPRKELVIFFDASYGEVNILRFIKEFLKELLQDRCVWGGYLFYQEANYYYPIGDAYISQNSYEEDGDVWASLTRPNTIYEMSIANEKAKMQAALNQKNKYRHIYPQTILSEHHLEEEFDGLPLTKWIEENSYGNVEKIGAGNWLWTIPTDMIQGIQVVFYDKNLLLGVK